MKPRIGPRPYWMPGTSAQLRDLLRQMGVTRINGLPLYRIRKAQLYAVYCAMRERKANDGSL